MQTILSTADPLAILFAASALVTLTAAVGILRRARADQTILDAFELGGRMSIDPVEVTGSRLLGRRIDRLQQLGVLKATPRGMLVPDIESLAAGIQRGRRLGRILLFIGLGCLAAAIGLALPSWN